MKPFFKFIAIVSIIPLLVGLYFFDNIKGYYRFKQYCEKEGGLRVYEPLEKNVGWWADDYDSAHMAAQLKYVAFVRYIDKKDGNEYDLQYVGRDPQRDSSFKQLPADQSKKIKYFWKNINEKIDGEIRLMRYGEKVLNIDNKVLVSYNMLGYEKFNRSHTLLDAPSEVYCFLDAAKKIGQIDGWIAALNTSFKN